MRYAWDWGIWMFGIMTDAYKAGIATIVEVIPVADGTFYEILIEYHGNVYWVLD